MAGTDPKKTPHHANDCLRYQHFDFTGLSLIAE
jgi:hypothetical protein